METLILFAALFGQVDYTPQIKAHLLIATPTKAPCDCKCVPDCKCAPCLCNVTPKPPVVSVVKAATATKATPQEASVRVIWTKGDRSRPFSGTAICNRTVLTCAHGFDSKDDGATITVDGKPAKVEAVYDDLDLAIVKTEHDLKPVPIAKAWPKMREQLVGYGYEIKNNGALWKYPSTVTLAYRGQARDIVLVTGAATAGRSGSGLFNAAGELVGVCRGALVRRNESIYTGLDSIAKVTGKPAIDSNKYAAPDFSEKNAPKFNSPANQLNFSQPSSVFNNCPNGQCKQAPAVANPPSLGKPTVSAGACASGQCGRPVGRVLRRGR